MCLTNKIFMAMPLGTYYWQLKSSSWFIVGIENNLLGKVTESLIDELKINREHYNVLKLMGHEFKDKENKLKDNKVKF